MNAAKVTIHSGPTHPQPTGNSSASGRGFRHKSTPQPPEVKGGKLKSRKP